MGFYLFGRVEGRAIARDIFLEGNTFVDSHSVDKEPLVGAFTGGIVFVLKRVEVQASYTILTPQFEHQKTVDSWGTARVLVKF